MAFCGNCGNQLPEGAKFCPVCHASVDEGVTDQGSTAQGAARESAQGAQTGGEQGSHQGGPQGFQQGGSQQGGPQGFQQGGSQQGGPQGSQQGGPNGPQGFQQGGPQGYQQTNGFDPRGGYRQQGQGFYQQGPGGGYYQQGPGQANQTFNQMGENMNRLVPKTKSEKIEVACFVMSILSVKFSFSMFFQFSNVIGLILSLVSVILLLVNREKTSNRTVQTLALIIGIVGICLSVTAMILVAAHVPVIIMGSYISSMFYDLIY